MTYKKAFEDNVVNFKVLNDKTWDVVEFSHLANKIYVTADEMMMGDSIFEKVVLDNHKGRIHFQNQIHNQFLRLLFHQTVF